MSCSASGAAPVTPQEVHIKRLLIVADRSLAVQAIRLALKQTSGFQVVGFIDGRHPVRAKLVELYPDVVLVDDMLQGTADTLERVREARDELPDAKIFYLTERMEESWVDEVLDAGVDAVFSKAVHPVALGTLLRETARANVVQRQRRRSIKARKLTARELEILSLAAQGDTNGHIARDLWITEQTVKFHLSNAYRKLGVRNRTEATRYVYLHELGGPQRVAS